MEMEINRKLGSNGHKSGNQKRKFETIGMVELIEEESCERRLVSIKT